MMMRGASRIFNSARTIGRRLGRDRSGSVISFLVVVPVLMGAAAVGIETGQLYRTKRQMQSAADAGALAGSVDRLAGKNTATITSTAQYEAQRNGFQNGVSTVTVTVNAPPLSGPNVSTPGAVEVIISKSQHFSLGAVLASWLGSTSSNFTMTSRSVAAQGTYTSTTSSAEGCMVALTPAAEQGVSFTSFNNFSSDCTIISNGTSIGTGSTTASVYLGSFNSVTLKSVWTRGSFVTDSPSNVTYTGAQPLQNQTTAVVDPYASLGTPSPGTCPSTPFSFPSGSSVTLSPGTYCNGLSITSANKVNNVYFTPGIYYITNGDLYITGVNGVSCPSCTTKDGVTIVLTQNTGNASDIGGVWISSDNNITLNAPSANPADYPGSSPPLYAGVLFYQDRGAPSGTMASTSKIFTVSSLNNATLNGIIYFPNNRIDISNLNNSSSSSTGCTVWIGRYIKFSSYNNNRIAGCSALGMNPASIVTTTTVTKGKVIE